MIFTSAGVLTIRCKVFEGYENDTFVMIFSAFLNSATQINLSDCCAIKYVNTYLLCIVMEVILSIITR